MIFNKHFLTGKPTCVCFFQHVLLERSRQNEDGKKNFLRHVFDAKVQPDFINSNLNFFFPFFSNKMFHISKQKIKILEFCFDVRVKKINHLAEIFNVCTSSEIFMQNVNDARWSYVGPLWQKSLGSRPSLLLSTQQRSSQY